MKNVTHERYETFDGNCRSVEAVAANAEDLHALEEIEKKIKNP